MGRVCDDRDYVIRKGGSVNVSAEVIPAAGDRKNGKGYDLFVDPEPARIGSLLIAVSLLAALCILGFIGPDHYTAGGL